MNTNYKILRLSVFISFLIVLMAFCMLEVCKLFKNIEPVREIMFLSIVPVSACLLVPGYLICSIFMGLRAAVHSANLWPILLSSFLFYTIFLFFLIKLIGWLRLKINK